MKRELEVINNQQNEIRNKYESILNENLSEVYKFELRDKLYELLRNYLIAKLDNLSDVEVIEIFKSALNEYREDHQFDSEWEDDE